MSFENESTPKGNMLNEQSRTNLSLLASTSCLSVHPQPSLTFHALRSLVVSAVVRGTTSPSLVGGTPAILRRTLRRLETTAVLCAGESQHTPLLPSSSLSSPSFSVCPDDSQHLRTPIRRHDCVHEKNDDSLNAHEYHSENDETRRYERSKNVRTDWIDLVFAPSPLLFVCVLRTSSEEKVAEDRTARGSQPYCTSLRRFCSSPSRQSHLSSSARCVASPALLFTFPHHR